MNFNNYNVEHDFGDIVYLKTDPEQVGRIITAIIFKPTNYVSYELSFNEISGWHLGIEISKEKDLMKTF